LRSRRNAPPITEEDFNSGNLNKKEKINLKRLEKKEKKKQKQQHKNMTINKLLQKQTISGHSTSSPRGQNTPQKSTTEDTTIEYATFDFSSGAPVPTYLLNKKKPSKSQLLKQVQEKKHQQQELQGTEQGDALVKQEAWDNMKKRAQGEKVLNDTDKLKKSIKRDQYLKKKRRKEWKQRVKKSKKTQDLVQKKRSDNIATAKERKFSGKRKKSFSNSRPPTKKQRVGFEGKRKEIINK